MWSGGRFENTDVHMGSVREGLYGSSKQLLTVRSCRQLPLLCATLSYWEKEIFVKAGKWAGKAKKT